MLHDGADYADGAATLDFDNPKMLAVKLKALPAGAYTVEWNTLTAEDNGPSNGTFTFTITDAAGGTGGGVGGDTAGTGGTPAAPLPTTGAADELPMLLLLAAGVGLLSVGLVLRRHTRRV